MTSEVWYRARFDVDSRSASFDEWGWATFHDKLHPTVSVNYDEYEVVKHTPKGAWLLTDFGTKRFVLRDATKAFARETQEEAYRDLVHRTNRRRKILQGQLKRVELALLHHEKGEVNHRC